MRDFATLPRFGLVLAVGGGLGGSWGALWGPLKGLSGRLGNALRHRVAIMVKKGARANPFWPPQ